MQKNTYFKLFLTVFFAAVWVSCETSPDTERANEYQDDDNFADCLLMALCDCEEERFDYFADAYKRQGNQAKEYLLQAAKSGDICPSLTNLTGPDTVESLQSILCALDRDDAVQCLYAIFDKRNEFAKNSDDVEERMFRDSTDAFSALINECTLRESLGFSCT